jgi:hypothetical protein
MSLLVIFYLCIHTRLTYSDSEEESEQESEQESEKEPEEESEEESEHESEPDSEQWEEYASVVVYSNGMNLSAAQKGTMNEIIAERDLGMGAVLVHELDWYKFCVFCCHVFFFVPYSEL